MAETEGVQSLQSAEEPAMEEDKEDTDSDEESDEEDSDDEEYFEVEKIMARKKRNGVFLYRVRWKGYPPSNDTWEPVGNLDIVSDMVQEFDAKEEEKARARQEERRIRKLRMEGKKLPGEKSSSDSSNSSDDERQLCEDTRFFKMLEKNKDMVFRLPDLYTNVKSRGKSVTEDSQETSSASVSKSSQPQDSEHQTEGQSNRGRGRGRPRGSSNRGRGSGRGRGRLPKKVTSEDSDEAEDEDKSKQKQKGTGRGRGTQRKKPVSESSIDSADSSDSDSGQNKNCKTPQKLTGERADEDDDSDDSVPLSKSCGKDQCDTKKGGPGDAVSDDSKSMEQGSGESVTKPSKKLASHDLEGKGDSEALPSAVKDTKGGQSKGKDKSAIASTKASDESEEPASLVKVKGRGRGRPKKTAQKVEEDEHSGDATSPVKGKGRGRGRPPKKLDGSKHEGNEKSEKSSIVKSSEKSVAKPRKKPSQKKSEAVEESGDSDLNADNKTGKESGKKKKKLLVEKAVASEDSDDSPTPVKKTGKGQKKKQLKGSTEKAEESDDSETPVKKKGNGRSRPPKRQISDNSEDGSDDSLVMKNSRKRGGKVKMKAIIEDTEESESDNTVPCAKISGTGVSKSQKNPSDDFRESDDSDDSVSLARKSGKGRVKPHKKIVSDDSEDGISDNSSVLSKMSDPVETTGKNTDTNGSVFTKKNDKSGQEADPSGKQNGNKKSVKSENDVQHKECTNVEKVSIGNTGDTVETVSKAGKVAETSKSFSANISVAQPKLPANQTTKAGSVKYAQSSTVIPVLEKLAMASMTDRILEEEKKPAPEKSLAASLETSEEHLGKKSVQEKGSNRNSESKETEVLEKKNPSGIGKGKKGSTQKRKRDLGVGNAKEAKEDGASSAKLPLLQASSSDDALSAPAKTQTVVPEESSNNDNGETTMQETSLASTAALSSESTTQEAKSSCVSTAKPESGKQHKNSTKASFASGKTEKTKSKKNSKSVSGHRARSMSANIDRNVKTTLQLSTQPPLVKESVHNSMSVPSSPVPKSSTPVASRKDMSLSAKPLLHQKQGLLKLEIPSVSKSPRTEVTESRTLKSDSAVYASVKSESEDNSSKLDQVNSGLCQPEAVDHKKKMRSSSSLDVSSPLSQSSRESGLNMLASGSGRDTPNSSREPLLPTPSRDMSSGLTSPSVSRDLSSLYPSLRDSPIPLWGIGRGSSSPRDQQQQLPLSPRDPHLSGASSKDLLGLGSSQDLATGLGFMRDTRPVFGRDVPSSLGLGRDLQLGPGYAHLSKDISNRSPSPRVSSFPWADSKDGLMGSSRHDLNANVSGKDSLDRALGMKSLSSLSSLKPLDSLSSSLYPVGVEKARTGKGLDAEFDTALQRINLDELEYLEKLQLGPVTPMELSHEELRQAVIDGNCYLVERALACKKAYNVDLPDNKGYTLLMNAVVKGFDDIIVHLLSYGASAQVQVKGVTALMVAVEQAECSTVFMLLQMGAHVNTVDDNGESALFKAVRRGDKQILKLILDHGADFNLLSRAGLTPLQMAKQSRLADIDTTLTEHINRVVGAFEDQANQTVRGVARLTSRLFPHHCVPLYESDVITIPFQYTPSLPSGPGMGCLLFIAHARFGPHEVKCRMYGQNAVQKVTLNHVQQMCLTEEPNFVLVCHPLITGWNKLVVHSKKDPTSKAKLIICAYRAELM